MRLAARGGSHRCKTASWVDAPAAKRPSNHLLGGGSGLRRSLVLRRSPAWLSASRELLQTWSNERGNGPVGVLITTATLRAMTTDSNGARPCPQVSALQVPPGTAQTVRALDRPLGAVTRLSAGGGALPVVMSIIGPRETHDYRNYNL